MQKARADEGGCLQMTDETIPLANLPTGFPSDLGEVVKRCLTAYLLLNDGSPDEEVQVGFYMGWMLEALDLAGWDLKEERRKRREGRSKEEDNTARLQAFAARRLFQVTQQKVRDLGWDLQWTSEGGWILTSPGGSRLGEGRMHLDGPVMDAFERALNWMARVEELNEQRLPR